MLQLEPTAVVPVWSWGEDGAGRAGGQCLQHPASQLGCCRGGHVPSIRVDVGQPRLKNHRVQHALASLHTSAFFSCQGDGSLKKGTKIFFFAV